MIARVEGVLLEKEPTRIVVDVQGVGYELLVSLNTFVELPDSGKTVALLVHTHMRDDAIQLFGFLAARERSAFELLLRASRVGPKLAQSILSGIAPDALIVAIRDGDVGVLRGVPGIGAKMAERIAVELRDRAAELAASASRDGAATVGAPALAPGVVEQALSALVNLGYPRPQAERVVRAANEDAGADASIEALIRTALRRLAQ